MRFFSNFNCTGKKCVNVVSPTPLPKSTSSSSSKAKPKKLSSPTSSNRKLPSPSSNNKPSHNTYIETNPHILQMQGVLGIK